MGLIKLSKSFVKLAPPNTHYSANDVRLCVRHGITYNLHLNDYQSWVLYFFSDQDSSFASLKFIKERDVCVDVGGNIGQTSLMMAKNVGAQGKVISFEPFGQTYDRFKENLSLNPRIKNITLEKIALGEKSAELTMYVENERNSGGNRIVPKGRNVVSEMQKVKVMSLDDYCANASVNRIDLIKIDVEGFEMKVLRGAERTIKKFKPGLFIEVNDANLKAQGDDLKTMIGFLRANGYSIFDPLNGARIESGAEKYFKGADIFCKAE